MLHHGLCRGKARASLGQQKGSCHDRLTQQPEHSYQEPRRGFVETGLARFEESELSSRAAELGKHTTQGRSADGVVMPLIDASDNLSKCTTID